MCCLPGLPVQPPGLGAILCQRDTPAPPHAAAPVQIPLSAPQCPRQNMLAPCGPFPRKVRAEQHFSTGSPCCPIQRPSQHLALALPSVPSKPPAASHAPPMLPTGGGVPPRHLVGARARQKPCRGRRRGAGQQQLQQPLSAQGPQRRGARASRAALSRAPGLQGYTRLVLVRCGAGRGVCARCVPCLGAGEWEGSGGYFAPKAALRAAAALTHAGAGWGRTQALEQPRARADDGKHHSGSFDGSRESRELS